MRSGYTRLLDGLGLLAGIVFAVTAVATTYDVALRTWAGGGVRGMVEWVEYGLFAATFLAAPWLLRQNGHVQVDFLVTTLPVAAQRVVRCVADLIGLMVCALLLWYAARVTWDAWSSGSIVLKSMVFPEWWIFAVVAVSMLLLVLEFARRLVVGDTAVADIKDF